MVKKVVEISHSNNAKEKPFYDKAVFLEPGQEYFHLGLHTPPDISVGFQQSEGVKKSHLEFDTADEKAKLPFKEGEVDEVHFHELLSSKALSADQKVALLRKIAKSLKDEEKEAGLLVLPREDIDKAQKGFTSHLEHDRVMAEFNRLFTAWRVTEPRLNNRRNTLVLAFKKNWRAD